MPQTYVFLQGVVAETQGWQLKRLLTFAKNRLANRPNRPRDPMLRSFMSAIGVFWPEPDTPEQPEGDESASSTDVEEESESEEDLEEDPAVEVGEG